jgi:sialate O-acetylesterase
MIRSIRISVIFFITYFFFQPVCFAQITLPKVFGDNMVLQRGIKIPIWGNSVPGSLIIAELGNIRTSSKANKEGKWLVRFPKFKEGGPYTLKIFEPNKPDSGIILKGILIGDVWLASGQSNMEWQVQQAQDA